MSLGQYFNILYNKMAGERINNIPQESINTIFDNSPTLEGILIQLFKDGKITGKPGEIDDAYIIQKLVEQGYEVPDTLDGSQMQVLYEAYSSAISKAYAEMKLADTLKNKKRIAYHNYDEILRIIKEGIKDESIKITEDNDIIPFSDILCLLKEKGYEEVGVKIPNGMKEVLEDAYTSARKENNHN